MSRESGFKTIADFVAAAKAKPGAMNFGSAGVGTATHLSAMRFMTSAGIEAVHIPFKGGPEAINEIIAGRLDFFFAPVENALPFVKDGMLRALVVNSTRRSAVLPDVPTTAEAGLIDAEYPFWIGMFVPAKTPRAVVDKLQAEAASALATPSVKSKLATLGVDPMLMSPTEFDAFIVKADRCRRGIGQDRGRQAAVMAWRRICSYGRPRGLRRGRNVRRQRRNVRSRTFEDYWAASTITGGVRPTLDAMTAAERDKLKARVRGRMPTDAQGCVTWRARANAVKARVAV